MRKENKIYLEWLLKAQEDEQAAEILLEEDGPPALICFHSHQIAEKCLKGYLVYQNKEFPKIHHLDILLEMSTKVDREFLDIKEEILYLRPFYFQTRYPGEFPRYTKTQAKEAFQNAIRVKEFVLKKVKV